MKKSVTILNVLIISVILTFCSSPQTKKRTEKAIQKQNVTGNSPCPVKLILAASAGRKGKIKKITKSKKDYLCRDESGFSLLHHAAERGRRSTASMLIKKGVPVNGKNKYGQTPLFFSANSSMVRLLIKNGADINAKDQWGETALFRGAEKGNVSLVKFLLKKRAKVNIFNKDHLTPLHYAVRFGTGRNHMTIIRAFVKAGADINARDKNGWTPLHYAVQQNKYYFVRLLASKKADMKARTTKLSKKYSVPGGSTPLHVAISQFNRSTRIFRYLLKKSDLTIKDDLGRTPLALARIESGRPGSEWYGTKKYKKAKRKRLKKIVKILEKKTG